MSKLFLAAVIGFLLGLGSTYLLIDKTNFARDEEGLELIDVIRSRSEAGERRSSAKHLAANSSAQLETQLSGQNTLEALILAVPDWSVEEIQADILDRIAIKNLWLSPNNVELTILLNRLVEHSPMLAMDMLNEIGLVSYYYRNQVFRTWAKQDMDGMLGFILASREQDMWDVSWALYLPNVEESQYYEQLMLRTGQSADQLAKSKRLMSLSYVEQFREIEGTYSNYMGASLNGLMLTWPTQEINQAVDLIVSLDDRHESIRLMKTLVEQRFKGRPEAALTLINTYYPNEPLLAKTVAKLYAASDSPDAMFKINEYTENTGDDSLLAEYINITARIDAEEAMRLMPSLSEESREKSLIAIVSNRLSQDRDGTIAWALNQANKKIRKSYVWSYVNRFPDEAMLLVPNVDDPEQRRILVRNIIAIKLQIDSSGARNYAQENGEEAYLDELQNKIAKSKRA